MKLWKVDVKGFGGIELHPKEVIGNRFVYHQTYQRATEIWDTGVRKNWGGLTGTHITIPRSCTTMQARKLRNAVLADVEEEKVRLQGIARVLKGVDSAITELNRVRTILEE